MKRTSQNEQILYHLKNIGTITPDESWNRYRIYRLSARIADLRKRGYVIDTHLHTYTDGYGKAIRFAEYELIAEPPGTANTERLNEGERYEDIFPSEDNISF